LWSDGTQTADLGDLQPGDYLLTVTDANGCVASDAFTVEDVTGISALSIDFGLQVYPNPTRGILNISAKEMIDELVMYDFTGRQVLSSQPRATVVSEQLENVDAGVYNVRVKINEQWITKRIEVIK
jgi:hypothetical protein